VIQIPFILNQKFKVPGMSLGSSEPPPQPESTEESEKKKRKLLFGDFYKK
jgi:hypothetical protein